MGRWGPLSPVCGFSPLEGTLAPWKAEVLIPRYLERPSKNLLFSCPLVLQMHPSGFQDQFKNSGAVTVMWCPVLVPGPADMSPHEAEGTLQMG